uniref:Farnesyl pyrophosphate synthase n=1 Tax=Phlebotomus papatasi TaxID=29031 RepID=A0A1B0D6G5_PHLPP
MYVQRSTDAQKEIMKRNFGKDDTEAVATVKQLYKDLSLPDLYATYEEDSYNMIKTQIQRISQKIPDEIFLILLDKMYKRKALEYNMQGGKKLRGISLIQSYELLVPKDLRTENNIKLAGYLGWCVEMLHATFLILDDIMDRSITRRGKPCWYKLEDIQASAVNDAAMIYFGIYQIIKEHFSHMDYYTELVDLFHETAFTMILGQVLDMKSQKQDVLTFKMEQYKTIAIYKSSYGYLSIACALHLAGYTSPEIFQQAKEIFTEIGYLFQTQDDFMDCFGDSNKTGKIGTDIQETTIQFSHRFTKISL